MKTARIAISLTEPLLARVREEVRRGRATSVSAYVSRAVAKQVEHDNLEEMLDEMLTASGGPMSGRERAWVDGVLGLNAKRRR